MTKKRYLPAVLFVLNVCIMTFTSYPSIGWWDSGFLTACAVNTGIPGPAGSILFVLTGRIFDIFLFFIPSVKAVTLVSIVSTSLTSVFLYFTLLEIFRQFNAIKDDLLTRLVAFSAALMVTFLYSIWLESNVTRVYTLGLFLTSVIIFLTVKIWLSQQNGEKARLFIMVVFLMGLDFTAHRLNSPFLPVFFLLLAFPLRKYLFNLKFWAAGLTVYLIAVSLHFYLITRAQLHPVVDIGNTGTFEDLYSWINMRRISQQSNFLLLFDRRAPLFDYQIKHMYLRYFAWNFIGKDGTLFFGMVPFLLGILGFFYCLFKRFKTWFLIFIIFFLFSFLLVFYLNVREGFHNVREIDRLFIPSFFIFCIWTGLGLYALFVFILKIFEKKESLKRVAVISFSVLVFILLPLNVIISNWNECSRRNFYFPTDWAYNFLNSCEQDAVLFTNGDNDTFPLWYLQYVEKFRTDITVANLSLLNTKFYLDQLLRSKNSFPVDTAISGKKYLSVILLDKPAEIKIPPPGAPVSGFTAADTFKVTYEGRAVGNRKLMFVQDYVLASFLKENAWKRPVYFAVTVSPQNTLGLSEYLTNVGLVNKLVPVKGAGILPEELENNLLNVYRYRSFNDKSVKADRNTFLLFNNFRYFYVRLAEYYLQSGSREKANEIFEFMKGKLPEWRFSEQQNEYVRDFERRLR
ncbi:DUF2723 domain-containing protein [candidate division KSB1 bacterium]